MNMRPLMILTMLAAAVLVGCDAGKSMQAGGGDQARRNDDANVTILLKPFMGVDHAEQAAKWHQDTLEYTKWKGLFITAEADRSLLCWGRYGSALDAKAQKNLRKAKKIYRAAMIFPLHGANPGPPEWDLRNADGKHSIAVAVFRDNPGHGYVGRKKFAVEYCRDLRKNDYEAYFYHGKQQSVVCIGAFPDSALLSVYENGEQKTKMLDPRMKQIFKDFRQLAVDGQGRQIDGKDVRSYLIAIPNKQADNAQPTDDNSWQP